MAITTYTELESAVTAWLEHDDLGSRIPEFIELFEAEANRRLRLLAMQQADVGTLNSATHSAPSDLLEVIAFRVDTTPRRVLEYLPPEVFFDGKYDTAGAPEFYTMVGRTFHFTKEPTASSTYGFTMTYYGRLAALSSSNEMNWLLTNAPDAYLYGTLKQAAPYLLDDQRVGMWSQLCDSALDGLSAADNRLRYRGGRHRARPVGVMTP